MTLMVERVALLLLLPIFTGYKLRLLSFRGVAESLSLVPGMPGMFLRRAWYVRTLASCGTNLSVALGAVIHTPEARIGNNNHFGSYTWVGVIATGDDVITCSHAELLSGRAQYGMGTDRPMRLQHQGPQRIVIGDDVWIGGGAKVSAHAASGCVVALGAVVVSNQDRPGMILGGVPARALRDRE